MDKAVIICGGECRTDLIDRETFRDAYIVAADSGCDTARTLGIVPHVIIGDLDSIKDVPDGIKIIRAKPEKDDTDTMLAIRYCLDLGARDITLIGGGGGRYDHLFSNVFMLEHLSDRGISARLDDGFNRVTVLADGEMVIPNRGGYFGVLALEDCVVTLSGCKYPLEGARLTRGLPYAVSNEVTGNVAKIKIRGKALIIESGK